MRGFNLLIALFPREFRAAFGAEMRAVFAAQLTAARHAGGWRGVARLWLRTSVRMTAAAWRERRANRLGHGSSRTIGLDVLRSDLGLTARAMIRRPWFAASVIAAISIGVGAVATIFSAVNAIVLRPLPGVRAGDHLVGIDRRSPDLREGASASFRLFSAMRDRATSLDGAAAWSRVALSVTAEGRDGASVAGAIVSSNYFSVLGVQPARGRFFLPQDDTRPLPDPEVVISANLWRTQLDGNDPAIGRYIRVNGIPYRVVGVAPSGFRGVFTPLKIDAWVPLSTQPHVRPGRDLTHAPWLWVFGRMRAGVDRDRARAELSQIIASWSASSPEPAAIRSYNTARLTPLTGLPDDARTALVSFSAVLMGAAGLVLIIAGANASWLLATRAVSRRRELSVRMALGAGRGRLVRQLLTETLVLFALGGCGGVLLAWLGTAALERVPLPGDTALSLEVSPDVRVVLFALAVSLIAGVIFGVGPALRGASRDLSVFLRDGAAGSTRRTWPTSALLIGQLACSIVLLAAAALFVRALDRGRSADVGFDTAGVLITTLNTEAFGYDDAQSAAFFRTVRQRVLALSAVEAAAYSTVVPLAATPANATIAISTGADGEARVKLPVSTAAVGDGYFETLQIPLRSGRAFVTADAHERPDVAVISEALALRAWPDTAAIGRTFDLGDRRVTVVGVARDTIHVSLDETPASFVYLPIASTRQSGLTLLVRARAASAPLAIALASEVRAIDPALPRPVMASLADVSGMALLPQRVAAFVTGVLGIGGLVLAAIGLYGSLAHAVSLRTRELGVRRALGARERDVVALVARQGLRVAAAGIVIGLAIAMLTTRALGTYLLGVSPLDGVALGAASVLFVAVALAATLIPARRAAATDPVVAMRPE